jgi:hypothetical protein
MAQDGSGQKNKPTEKGRDAAALFPVFCPPFFCPHFVACCAMPFLLSCFPN